MATCDLALAELMVADGDVTRGAAVAAALEELRADRKAEGDLVDVAKVDILRGRLLLEAEPAAARQLFDDAMTVARACADNETAAEAEMRKGFALVRLGDVAAGVRTLRRGRRVLERHHRADLVVEGRLFLMRTFAAAGDDEAAKREARILHRLLEHSGHRRLLGEVVRVRGVPRPPAPAA
ncbi:MAG TPA: hypothetical protein VM345_11980 [Acidimicrobiales bacterium]|nr:hypothetical protein [Acidimicrobiales bacterium]